MHAIIGADLLNQSLVEVVVVASLEEVLCSGGEVAWNCFREDHRLSENL